MDQHKVALEERLLEHRAQTDAGLDSMRIRIELATKTGLLA